MVKINTPVNFKWFLGGTLCTLFGILSSIWTPYDLCLEERLRMRPGLPPFDWWYKPPDVQRLKLYLFNITNADRFLSGQDAKLKMEQIGPIIFREIFTYTDVEFNDNGTMSYTSRRDVVYDPSLNNIDLNTVLTVPNAAVLLGASYFRDANYIFRNILNIILDKIGKTIVKKTIYEILYNHTDPFLSIGYKWLKSFVVFDNLAIIPLMSRNRSSRVTVYTGTKFGHQKFFLIDKYNGSSYVPSINSECKDDITNASDTMLYSQKLPKTRKVRYFYDLICKPLTFLFEDEIYQNKISSYRFRLSEDDFDRTKPLEDDCYKSDPTLPNGLVDMSLCWNDFSIVASYPHFLYGDPKLRNYVDGMTPNASLHSSFSIIEPESGITLKLSAKIQINLYVKPLVGFHKMFDKFSDMVIPYCLLEKSGEAPPFVIYFLYFVFFLPVIGWILSILSIVFGLYCFWRSAGGIREKRYFRGSKRKRMEAIHTAETETFLQENASEF